MRNSRRRSKTGKLNAQEQPPLRPRSYSDTEASLMITEADVAAAGKDTRNIAEESKHGS